MKKLYIFLTTLVFFMVPFVVFAAVDVVLLDTSTEDAKSISISIDTQTDTLESVSLPIKYSEGVTVTEVTTGDINCSTINYSEALSTEDSVVINCELENASALDGVLANLTFTSTQDADSFEVLDNEELELGSLSLGDTVNIAQVQEEETTQPESEETLPPQDEDGIPLEENALITTQEDTLEAEENDGFNIAGITEYLPYVLIGGSVILLISIIAVLLGKKKGPKTPKTPTTPANNTTPVNPQAGSQNDKPENKSLLKRMVNSDKKVKEEPKQEIPQQSPAPQTVQTRPTPQQPPVQSPTPQVSTTTKEEDLEEIMKRESASLESQQTQQPNQAPVETPQQPQQQNPFPQQPSITQQGQTQPQTITQVSPTVPPQEAAPEVPSSPSFAATNTPQQPKGTTQPQAEVPESVQPTTTRPPASKEDLQNIVNEEVGRLKKNEPATPEYPSVPPAAVQPQPNIKPDPVVPETPEELPEVPPAM